MKKLKTGWLSEVDNHLFNHDFTNEVFHINVDDSTRMDILLGKLPKPTTSGMLRQFSYSAFLEVARSLPEDLRNQLLDLKSGVIHPRYVYIKGLPIDKKLPQTPNDGRWSPGKETFISEAVLLGLSQMIGVPYAFIQEKDGRILHQITPAKDKLDSLSSSGSKVNLTGHVEAAFDATLKPDFVVLVCLRSDAQKQAVTSILDIRDVLPTLSKETIRILSEPRFVTRVPFSFTDAGAKEVWSDPTPVLGGFQAIPELVVDAELTFATDTAAEDALEELITAFSNSEKKNKFHLEPGDCLVIPNRTSIHERTSFDPTFDGKDRWLQRVYVKQSLWSGRSRKVNKFGIYK